jgi:hypothetical protein
MLIKLHAAKVQQKETRILFLRPNPVEKRRNGLFERRTGRKAIKTGNTQTKIVNLYQLAGKDTICIRSSDPFQQCTQKWSEILSYIDDSLDNLKTLIR